MIKIEVLVKFNRNFGENWTFAQKNEISSKTKIAQKPKIAHNLKFAQKSKFAKNNLVIYFVVTNLYIQIQSGGFLQTIRI